MAILKLKRLENNVGFYYKDIAGNHYGTFTSNNATQCYICNNWATSGYVRAKTDRHFCDSCVVILDTCIAEIDYSDEYIFTTGAYIVPIKVETEHGIRYYWIVDRFEDDTFQGGELISVNPVAYKSQEGLIGEEDECI